MDNILKNILDELLIKDLPHHNMSITFDHLGKPILIPNKDYKEFVLQFVLQFVIIIRLFDELCNFDLDYKREDYLNIILNYDFNSINQNEVYNLSTPVNSDLNLSHFNDKNDIS
ncbi:hypothetical protein ACN08P_19875 [Photobacterium leiognathi subsp. mandapamensis]|uniref:hypothetical protein n=1 Tax=Photobacterium leiognathi TaxID=553611 RepID=UPI003AF33670